jgi:hypothetical protein
MRCAGVAVCLALGAGLLMAAGGVKNSLARKDTSTAPPAVYEPALLVSPNNRAFRVGERLEFSVDYGFINAGDAVMCVKESVTVAGRPCFHITSSAVSNDFFTPFYRVNDLAETYMDMDGFFPWKFGKKLEEGNYWADQKVDYDQRNHRAFLKTNSKKGLRADTVVVPAFVQDVLSSIYYVRTLNLTVGKSVFIDNHAERKVYPLEVKVYKKERVEVPAGTFDCLKVEPFLKSTGIFKNEGRLIVWLTNDVYKVPVLMKSKVAIGSVSVRLQKMKR